MNLLQPESFAGSRRLNSELIDGRSESAPMSDVDTSPLDAASQSSTPSSSDDGA